MHLSLEQEGTSYFSPANPRMNDWVVDTFNNNNKLQIGSMVVLQFVVSIVIQFSSWIILQQCTTIILVLPVRAGWQFPKHNFHQQRGRQQQQLPLLSTRHGVVSLSSGLLASTTARYCKHRERIVMEDGQEVNVIRRTVPITSDWNVTVMEVDAMSDIVEEYWSTTASTTSSQSSHSSRGKQDNAQQQQKQILDPFGLVSWPGAVVAAHELIRHADTVVRDKNVLIFGAGVGIEAQVAAVYCQAKSVLATDIHPLTLRLLEYGAALEQQQETLSNCTISTMLFDIAAESVQQPLPNCDLIVIADVLYNDELAAHVVRRCVEARTTTTTTRRKPKILITDSQRFVKNFDKELTQQLRCATASLSRSGGGEDDDKTPYNKNSVIIAWSNRTLASFRGSGVVIDEDQTYDVQARVLWIGLEDDDNDDGGDDKS